MSEKEYNLYDYWKEFQDDIAEIRHWKRSEDTGTIPTKEAYDSMMETLARVNPETILTKPLASLSFYDLFNTLLKVRSSRGTGKMYKPSTMASYVSLLNDIQDYAQMKGHAVKILDKYRNTVLQRTFDFPRGGSGRKSSGKSAKTFPDDSKEDAVNRLRQKIEKDGYLRKSLTMPEMQSIMRMIVKHYREDGRYIGLALSIYAGLRPGECRALQWKDLDFIPGVRYAHRMRIHHVLDSVGREKDHPKSANGFRIIPIHMELYAILNLWYNYIGEKTGKSATGYIVCKENDFGTPCSYKEYASFAQNKVFSKLGTELRQSSKLEMTVMELEKDPVFDPDENLTLYVLRRNFWTWLQYGTQCSKLEKLYVMGHKMERDNRNMRTHFSSPKASLKIWCYMQQFVILPELRKDITKVIPDPAQYESFRDIGFTDITFDPECWIGGPTVTLKADINCLDPGDQITIEALTPVSEHFRLVCDIEKFYNTSSTASSHRINTSASTILAIDNARKDMRSPITFKLGIKPAAASAENDTAAGREAGM